jgi:hypothetical protein
VQTAASDLKSSVEGAARDVETGVRNVENELNAGATDSTATVDGETARALGSSPLPNEPGGEMGDATPSELPRQPSLPGLDRI